MSIDNDKYFVIDGDKSEKLVENSELRTSLIIKVDSNDIDVDTNDNNGNKNRFTRRTKIILGICTSFALFAIGCVFALYHMGYFDAIDRDIRFDGHGNAIEPNTGVKLPLVIDSEVSLPGEPKIKSKQRLIGMYLKASNVLSLKLKIFVVGFYVNWDTGKKLLLPWKNSKRDILNPDPELVKLLTSGESIPGTLKYIMTMTIPKTGMYDYWVKDLMQIFKDDNLDQNQSQELQNAFHQWLARTVHNHDQFDFSWSYPKPLTDDSEKVEQQHLTGTMEFRYNGKIVSPIEKSNEMIHASVLHEFKENGGFLVDLLDLLWEH